MTAKQVINHFGGYSATAKALTDAGHPISRQGVHKWAKSGVPADRVEVIRKLMEADND